MRKELVVILALLCLVIGAIVSPAFCTAKYADSIHELADTQTKLEHSQENERTSREALTASLTVLSEFELTDDQKSTLVKAGIRFNKRKE